MEVLDEVYVNVSVIIPARNAANTLAETLESLSQQTFPGWRGRYKRRSLLHHTGAIAEGFAAQDALIRVVHQPPLGVSAARNAVIHLAHYDSLLFLDADDLLSPVYLERMTSALTADRDLDAVYCGWARIAPDGTHVGEQSRSPSGELFADLAHFNVFAIHTCIVRRSLVEIVGGFDTSLRTCEDWDLWQRIARTGALLHFHARGVGALPYALQSQPLSIGLQTPYRWFACASDKGTPPMYAYCSPHSRSMPKDYQ